MFQLFSPEMESKGSEKSDCRVGMESNGRSTSTGSVESNREVVSPLVKRRTRLGRRVMIRLATVCTIAVAAFTATNAAAIDLGLGIFKKKTPPQTQAKADPGTTTKQLMATLQSDTDSNRRKAAAEAMRNIDPRTSPEIITSLVSSLQNDPAPSVRAMAALSLGSIKFVYPSAGAVLEAVEKNDPDTNVRAAAKSALWNYHVNGYRSGAGSSKLTQSPEPPLAVKTTPAPVKPLSTSPAALSSGTTELQFRPITQGVGKGGYYQPTNEPPLATPKNQQAPMTTPSTIPVPEIQKPYNPEPVVQPIPMVPSIPSGEPTIIPPGK